MASNQEVQLHPLTCVLCKARKIRCDRRLPRCSRCTAQNAECNYPTRQKRRPNKRKERSAELDAMLERVRQIESAVQSHLIEPQRASPQNEADTPSSLAYSSPQVPTPISPPEVPLRRRSLSDEIRIGTLATHENLDIFSALENAVRDVSKAKLRKTFHAARSTEAIVIPTNLAKTWISNFFRAMPANMTGALVENQKLLTMIPDLMDQQHVYIEPAVMVLYHVVLYHGCCIPTEPEIGAQTITSVAEYLEKTYWLTIRTLPGWQRTSCASTLDMTVAIMVTRAAVECHDFELGFQMHKLACQYAAELRLHLLDADEDGNLADVSKTDVERRRFWDLVQYDVYFRLILDKPSAISTPMAEWKVNLPYLHTGLEGGMDTEPAIMFLFCAHITLEVASFYTLFDGTSKDERIGLLPKVEAICHRMRERYQEWQIDSIMRRVNVTSIDGWLVADAAMASMMCIILMLRLIGAVDSPIVLEASRQVLQMANGILQKVPTLAVMALTFFSLSVFMPYAVVADHVSRQAALSQASLDEDIALLTGLRDIVASICQKETDFVPLMRAMQYTCERVQAPGQEE